MSNFSRRGFLAAGTAALSLGAMGRVLAQDASDNTIRIGTVFPSKTGSEFIRASTNDFIGDGGRMGAVLADSQLGELAETNGLHLKLLNATSPTVAAAIRAGERLVETGNICALVGGVGEGQAHALAQIAERARIPFFNVGETDDALRGVGCSRYVFHVEASDAMYLDALAELARAQGYARWYVVADTTARGEALQERAALAAEKSGSTIVGSSSVRAAQAIYYTDVDKAKAAEADVIVILLQAYDQFNFILQMEEAGIEKPVLTLPETITQTRDYIAAARYRLPKLNPRHRIALWETTTPDAAGQAFNAMIRAQWGEGADPTAWSSYHAIKIILETVTATGTTDAEAMIAHLENPDTAFDVLKGNGVSFRPWDHQLRQPLYGLSVDQDAAWDRMNLDSRIGIAKYEGTIPGALPADADARNWLDQLGNSASHSTCKL